MDKLEPGDLGISEDDFQGLTHPLCVPVVGGADAKGFEMTMFMLPKGGGIPLHDHPQSEMIMPGYALQYNRVLTTKLQYCNVR